MKNNIKLPKGFRIGHADFEGRTGVTAMLCAEDTVGGVCVRGGAPGTRETDLLSSEKAISQVDAVVLAGNSAFGLASVDGVMQYLVNENRGFQVGTVKIPLVVSAVIFDIATPNDMGRINAKLGLEACKNATENPDKWGSVGVGCGASVGKILGPMASSKGGIGASTVSLGDIFITSITVVNAVGDVWCHKTNKIIAGVCGQDGNFLDINNLILSGAMQAMMATKGGNTTLSIIITNVNLDKLQCNKLASIAHNGYAQSIKPVHTDYDGDTIFTLSSGDKQMDFTVLSVMAVEAVSQSITQAVKL
ncbi:MAG: P1 family peptidase [Firmicutes bacterium]|nr:P1 family peptidase [Bacillota bacterium]